MHLYRGLGLCVAAVLVAGGLALAGDAGKELKALEGTWDVTAVTDNGKEVPADKIKGVQFTFKGDLLTMATGKGGSEDFKVKVDPAKKPKQIDLSQKGTTTPAIYEVKGDTLLLALPPRTSKERPTELESKEKSRVSLITLKRAKKGA